jgi:hypothetical protein
MDRQEEKQAEYVVEILEAKFLGELTTAIRLYKEEWEGDKYQPSVSSPKFVDGVWRAEASRLA